MSTFILTYMVIQTVVNLFWAVFWKRNDMINAICKITFWILTLVGIVLCLYFGGFLLHE